MELGNLSDLLGAAGTVGAFFVTYRLLREEVGICSRAQASQVAAWAEARPAFEACGYDGVTIHLLNANTIPIFDCHVVVRSKAGDRFDIEHGTVGPNTHIAWPEDAALPGYADDLDLLQLDDLAGVELRFTDSSGHPWRRSPDGRLSRLKEPPTRVMVPFRG